MQALKTVGPCLRPDWQHLSPWEAAAHETFPFQNPAGGYRYWELSMHKWYERGSHLLSCCGGCSWHHCHRVQIHTPRKDTKNQFPSAQESVYPYQNDCWFMSAAEDSQTKTLLSKGWVPWRFKSWYRLTSAFKTFKSIANNYHTLKSQIKYFVELKYIYFWHETFLSAGKIPLQFLTIEYFDFRSWL